MKISKIITKTISISVSLFVLFLILTVGVDYTSIKRELKENNEYKHKLDSLMTKDIRIKNMEKALLINYGHLSKYEAHYYCVIYDEFATQYNVPWEIYPAVVRIESNFSCIVRSEKGAKGLTQVIEGTGKLVSAELGISYVETETLWNDILNMVIGFTYLSKAINQKGLEDGVKAYIGGLGFEQGRKDISSYRTTVHQEYERLRYVYKGVCTEKDTAIVDTSKIIKIDTTKINNK